MSGQQDLPMVRPISVALLLILPLSPAIGQRASNADAWLFRNVTIQTAEQQPPSVEVGSYGRLGVGMFGLKSGTPRGKAVTVREVSEPRQRRAGIGFSLKF